MRRQGSVKGPEVAAILLESSVLGCPVWLVSRWLPRAEWPGGAVPYTGAELELLLRLGRDASVLPPIHAVKELLGATLVNGRLGQESPWFVRVSPRRGRWWVGGVGSIASDGQSARRGRRPGTPSSSPPEPRPGEYIDDIPE